jgi:predicted peptidase
MIQLALALNLLIAQSAPPVAPGIRDLELRGPRGTLTYAISVPRGYTPARPAPLVLVLHPGGQRIPHYGREFMKFLVQPALGDLGAVMIAPDCPANSWTDQAVEESVVDLVEKTLASYAIDRRRVLVVGYSMGGRGTWFMAARHGNLFTAAIPMAASGDGAPVDALGTIPTYVIHSRDDEVVPFGPAETLAQQLQSMGRPVRFEALWNLTHFQMGGYTDALRRAGRWVAQRWSASR